MRPTRKDWKMAQKPPDRGALLGCLVAAVFLCAFWGALIVVALWVF